MLHKEKTWFFLSFATIIIFILYNNSNSSCYVNKNKVNSEGKKHIPSFTTYRGEIFVYSFFSEGLGKLKMYFLKLMEYFFRFSAVTLWGEMLMAKFMIMGSAVVRFWNRIDRGYDQFMIKLHEG